MSHPHASLGRILRISLFSLVLVGASPFSLAADPDFDSSQLTIDLSTPTPQQIAAFYEARGFSDAMIEILRRQCFITVFIKNKSQNIIWLDLAQWQFENANGPIIRRDRNHWKARWQKMQIPLAHQSTFRWTLLPEQLDFRPDEREGGNITLPRDDMPITIRARFDTGEQRQGQPINVTLDGVRCAAEP